MIGVDWDTVRERSGYVAEALERLLDSINDDRRDDEVRLNAARREFAQLEGEVANLDFSLAMTNLNEPVDE